MKKIIVLIAALLLTGCYAPGKYPTSLLHRGNVNILKFTQYYLEGKICSADESFSRSIEFYKRIGASHSIAEAYIRKYLLLSYTGIKEPELLQKAAEYAKISSRYRYVERKIDLLEHPSKHITTKETTYPNNLYASVMLRKNAAQNKDIVSLKKAVYIDERMGWSLFLIQDFKIMSKLEPEKEKKLSKRIYIIESTIDSKCE